MNSFGFLAESKIFLVAVGTYTQWSEVVIMEQTAAETGDGQYNPQFFDIKFEQFTKVIKTQIKRPVLIT